MGRPRRKGQDSPIDNKQKALAEQEEKLRRKMQELQQLIQDAPGVAKEAENRRRQDLVIRASQPSRRAESPNTLFDKRYDVSFAAPRRRGKSLRAEQQEQRLKALVLCVVLIICLLVIWTKFLH